jgi:hypothetical protein
MDLTVVHVKLTVTRGDRQDSHHFSALVHDKQYLSFQIDLHVRVPCVPRLWSRRSAQSIQLVQSEFSGSCTSFNFLERYQGVSRIRIELAVNGPAQ